MENNSFASTTCSSLQNDSVKKSIKNDSVRYKRKGYGLIIAILAALGYFTIFPKFLNHIYPSLVAGWDHRWFFLLTAGAVHFLAHVTCYIFSYFIYSAKLPFFERYKANDSPWPWDADPKEWRKLLKKSFLLFLVNSLIIGPLITYADILTSGVFVRMSVETLPSLKDTILQVSFCMIIEDFCFYWGHRLLHHPLLYPYVHKIHHEHVQTISIANEYVHPIEFLLAGLLPSSIGPKLLGKQMHIVTLWIWLALRSGESVEGHCGYDFSWSPFRLLPLSGSGTYHAYHHSANVGNYGSLFTFWDTVFKTNKDYWRWLSKREKESKLNEIRSSLNKMQSKPKVDSDYIASKLDGKVKEGENQEASSHQKRK